MCRVAYDYVWIINRGYVKHNSIALSNFMGHAPIYTTIFVLFQTIYCVQFGHSFVSFCFWNRTILPMYLGVTSLALVALRLLRCWCSCREEYWLVNKSDQFITSDYVIIQSKIKHNKYVYRNVGCCVSTISGSMPGRGTHYMKVTTYAPPFRPPFFRSLENLYSFDPYILEKNGGNVVFRPLFLIKIRQNV